MTFRRVNSRTAKPADANDLMADLFSAWMRQEPVIEIPDWAMEVEGFRERLDLFTQRSVICGEEETGDGVMRYCAADAGHGGDCFGIDITNTTKGMEVGL